LTGPGGTRGVYTTGRKAIMPRIIVTSDPTTERPGVVTLDERVASTDLQSEHHAVQLVERVGWAVHDADDVEEETVGPGLALS
jgi:hypothetical protein